MVSPWIHFKLLCLGLNFGLHCEWTLSIGAEQFRQKHGVPLRNVWTRCPLPALKKWMFHKWDWWAVKLVTCGNGLTWRPTHPWKKSKIFPYAFSHIEVSQCTYMSIPLVNHGQLYSGVSVYDEFYWKSCKVWCSTSYQRQQIPLGSVSKPRPLTSVVVVVRTKIFIFFTLIIKAMREFVTHNHTNTSKFHGSVTNNRF